MSATPREHRVMLILLLGLFALRAVTTAIIVPPWQGADEPAHFNLTYLLSFYDGTTRAASSERAVLESMARYRWWQPRGERTPDPLPQQFLDVRQTLADGTYAQPFYYGLGAMILRVTRPDSLESAYWHLRALSVVLATASVVLAWAGAVLLFGAATALGVLVLATLHPQFLLTALTVSPDVLVIFFGAFIWWETGRLVRGDHPAFSVALILLAAAAALLTKRTAVPLAGAALISVTMTVVRLLPRLTGRRNLVTAAVVIVAGAAILAWVASPDVIAQRFMRVAQRLVTFWTGALELRRGVDPSAPELTLPMFVSFVPEAIDHSWWSAGWGRLPVPRPWVWFTRAVTLVALGGAAMAAIHRPSLRKPLLIASLFFVCQMAAVFAMASRSAVLPQARFVFPAFAPAAALIWTGLVCAMPERVQPHAPVLVAALLAALDLSAFTLVLVPAYLS